MSRPDAVGDRARLGVVAIGRNEGERLRVCLASIRRLHPDAPAIYVDSASTDGSADVAAALGVRVHALDATRPMNASRGRAEGLDMLLAANPELAAVLFIDGDCELREGFVVRALDELERDPKLGAVAGRRRERHPERSVYNRMMDLEWNVPPGEAEACGGDSVMRVAAVRGAGGWDPTVTAGEEPQLCARMRGLGYRIRRIDAEMTIHDSAMTTLGQWLRRERRTGHGALDLVRRFGAERHPDFAGIVRRARRAALGPVAASIGGAGAAAAGLLLVDRAALAVPAGLIGLCMGFLLVVVQWARSAASFRRRGLAVPDAARAAVATVLGKFAQVQGQLDWHRSRRGPRGSTIV